MIKIYTLADPKTKEVRYVGKSNHPNKRYSNHLSKGTNTHTGNWIKSLKSQGLKPKLEIIDSVSVNEWEFWERYWINQFKAWGFRLTNHLEGGGGNQIGRTRPDTPWNKGKKLSETTRNRMSQSHKNLDHSWKRGRKQSPETIEKRISKCSGTDHTNSKLSVKDIQAIRSSELSCTKLARIYNISSKGINRIKRCLTYKSIPLASI